MAARRGPRHSRTGTFLVLAGIVGVLSATFLVGVWTGHNWPVLFGHAKASTTEPSPARRVAERPRPTGMLPALTFYDELKAPLTAPPPPPPRRPRPPKPAETVQRETLAEASAGTAAEPAATRAEPAAPALTGRVEPAVAAAPVDPNPRFTVQVGAYNVRTAADTLRATLASAGHDARVVEAASSGAARYRVQVGAFATRQAAQEAATRLTAERALQTFVTTR